jgi:hypothetical protein
VRHPGTLRQWKNDARPFSSGATKKRLRATSNNYYWPPTLHAVSILLSVCVSVCRDVPRSHLSHDSNTIQQHQTASKHVLRFVQPIDQHRRGGGAVIPHHTALFAIYRTVLILKLARVQCLEGPVSVQTKQNRFLHRTVLNMRAFFCCRRKGNFHHEDPEGETALLFL